VHHILTRQKDEHMKTGREMMFSFCAANTWKGYWAYGTTIRRSIPKTESCPSSVAHPQHRDYQLHSLEHHQGSHWLKLVYCALQKGETLRHSASIQAKLMLGHTLRLPGTRNAGIDKKAFFCSAPSFPLSASCWAGEVKYSSALHEEFALGARSFAWPTSCLLK
jgi:hypothetical protein